MSGSVSQVSNMVNPYEVASSSDMSEIPVTGISDVIKFDGDESKTDQPRRSNTSRTFLQTNNDTGDLE